MDKRTINNDQFRLHIENGNITELEKALTQNHSLANLSISWFLNQTNYSDPLHYVCDCVFNEKLQEDHAAKVAALLLEHGALVNGSPERESPLIAAASLGVESVAKLLIQSGADLELTSVFGARALHWAASMGLPSTVELLIDNGADIKARCTEFSATPLFWAVVGFGPNGPNRKRDPLTAAKLLIDNGAEIDTTNIEGVSAIQCAQSFQSDEMARLLVMDAGNL